MLGLTSAVEGPRWGSLRRAKNNGDSGGGGGNNRGSGSGRNAQQRGSAMLERVGQHLGHKESERIQQRTGLSEEKVARMAGRRDITVKPPNQPSGISVEQANQGAANAVEANVNQENQAQGQDWSSRFDELNSQWEQRFAGLEAKYGSQSSPAPEGGRQPVAASALSDASAASDSSSSSSAGSFAANLDRLFATSKDDPTVVNPGSNAYQSAGGSGGARRQVDEFAGGRSPNGAYVNDPRDYHRSGTVGSAMAFDYNDFDYGGYEVKQSHDGARGRTPGGQPLAGTALNFAL